MSVITELIRVEANGAISFGNYELDQKSKISDFEYNGDLYKVKTFKEITKLERNGMFAYESVPGTTVTNYKRTEDTVSFEAEGIADTQVIIGVEDDTEYSIIINGVKITKLERNGMFAYESVPGTTVTNYKRTEDTVSFEAEGIADTQVIIGVEDDTEYSIIINGVKIDEFETNLSGKLVISLDLSEGKKATVTVEKL